jgi:hypothetical protein
MIYTDISYFSFIPYKTKLKILKGKRKLSENDYNELIKISNKPFEELKKIEAILKNLKKNKSNKNKYNDINKEKKDTLNNLLNKLENNTKLDESDLLSLKKIDENTKIMNNTLINNITDANNVPKILRDFQDLEEEEIEIEKGNGIGNRNANENQIKLKPLNLNINNLNNINTNPEKILYDEKNPNLNPNIANRINDLKNAEVNIPNHLVDPEHHSNPPKIPLTMAENMELQMQRVDKEMSNNLI